MATQTSQPTKSDKKELDPEILGMLERLRANWTVVDAEDADEQTNAHTDFTLVGKALSGLNTSLPPYYTGVFRRSLRKTNFVVQSRYSDFSVVTDVKFGDLIPASVVNQYLSQGATSLTLSSLDISYFASPLAEASTGVSNLYYVASDEAYNYSLLPIHSANVTTMELAEVYPIPSTPYSKKMLTIDVQQTSLRRIYQDGGSHSGNAGLDAGFDVAVYFKFFVNGLPQSLARRCDIGHGRVPRQHF